MYNSITQSTVLKNQVTLENPSADCTSESYDMERGEFCRWKATPSLRICIAEKIKIENIKEYMKS